jgi:hypothetical protein
MLRASVRQGLSAGHIGVNEGQGQDEAGGGGFLEEYSGALGECERPEVCQLDRKSLSPGGRDRTFRWPRREEGGEGFEMDGARRQLRLVWVLFGEAGGRVLIWAIQSRGSVSVLVQPVEFGFLSILAISSGTFMILLGGRSSPKLTGRYLSACCSFSSPKISRGQQRVMSAIELRRRDPAWCCR